MLDKDTIESQLGSIPKAATFMGRLAGWGDGIERVLQTLSGEIAELSELRSEGGYSVSVSTDGTSRLDILSGLVNTLLEDGERLQEKISQVEERLGQLAQWYSELVAEMEQFRDGFKLPADLTAKDVLRVSKGIHVYEQRLFESEKLVKRLSIRLRKIEEGDAGDRRTFNGQELSEILKASRQTIANLVHNGDLEDIAEPGAHAKAITIDSVRAAVEAGKVTLRDGVEL